MKKEMKYLLLALCALFLFHCISYWYQKNLRPIFIARAIVDPTERYAFDDERDAYKYGKELLPHLIAESGNFKELNANNAGRLSRILGEIKTAEVAEIGKDLYSRKETWSKLAGAHILAHHDLLNGDLRESSFLVRKLCSKERLGGRWSQKPSDLAAEVLAHFDSEKMISYFSKAASNGNTSYYTCKHLARSKLPVAIPGLFACVQDCFSGCERISSRLLYFGEKSSVGELIKRLPDKSDRYISRSDHRLAELLRHITGKDYPTEISPWFHWWEENKAQWSIPQRYQNEESHRVLEKREPPFEFRHAIPLLIFFGAFFIGPILIGLYRSNAVCRYLALEPKNAEKLRYAGFWPRLSAAFIDGLLLMPLFICLFLFPPTSNAGILLFALVSNTAPAFYNIFFHARYGATIGKMFNHVQVVSVDGSKITLRQAIYRHSIDLLLSFISCASLIVAVGALPDAWFAEHGMLGIIELENKRPQWGSWAYGAGQLWVWSELIVLLLNKKRRALHDFIGGTVVIFRPKNA